jgi:hypothetical protein
MAPLISGASISLTELVAESDRDDGTRRALDNGRARPTAREDVRRQPVAS